MGEGLMSQPYRGHVRAAITVLVLQGVLALCGCGGGPVAGEATGSRPPVPVSAGTGKAPARPTLPGDAGTVVPNSEISAIGLGEGPQRPSVAAADEASLQAASWFAPEGDAIDIEPSTTYRHALLSGSGMADVIVGTDGSKTVLVGLSGTLTSFMFSPDEKWFGVNTGGDDAPGPVELFHVKTGKQYSSGETVSFPSQMTSTDPDASPVLIGFTPHDDLVVSLGTTLWSVSRDGSTATLLTVHDSGCCNMPMTLLYTTSPQGLIAMISRQPASDGSTTDLTDLLNSSGTLVHQFPGGDPLSFSPDGSYLLIDLADEVTNPDAPLREEACSTTTFACIPLPGQADNEWLPNGDLAIGSNSANVNGLGLRWWDVSTRAYIAVPSVFAQFSHIDNVLPTALMGTVRSALGTSYAAGGD
jgi:hypothetical protein